MKSDDFKIYYDNFSHNFIKRESFNLLWEYDESENVFQKTVNNKRNYENEFKALEKSGYVLIKDNEQCILKVDIERSISSRLIKTVEHAAQYIEKKTPSDDPAIQNRQYLKFFRSTLTGISFSDYVFRCIKYISCAEAVLGALILMDRFIDKTNVLRCKQNIHCLFFTALTVSQKSVSDESYLFSNEYMARLGGMSCLKLNNLEREFLEALAFDVSINPKIYIDYINVLECRFQKYEKIKKAISSPSEEERQLEAQIKQSLTITPSPVVFLAARKHITSSQPFLASSPSKNHVRSMGENLKILR